jgi:hypothetical protein
MTTTFLKQLRPIDPSGQANDGPRETPWTAAELAVFAAGRAEQVACAMARTAAVTSEPATSRRDMYRHHLKMIAYSLNECARLNPNESHGLMLILLDIKNLQTGNSKPISAEDLDFGEPLEAGMPEHRQTI